MRKSPDTEESIRCTVCGCSCVYFKPGSVRLRSCDRCGHGWVAHALEKLRARPPSGCGPVEVALPGLVFDLSSLVLYGAQAVPVRLKILLDRLYSILTPEQVGRILHTLGWSLGDYVRGYMLQYPSGKVLDRWAMVTADEEPLVLAQFLRFGETRPIVELMARQGPAAGGARLPDPESKLSPTGRRSDVGAFFERDAGAFGRGESRRFEKSDDAVHHFENFLGGLSLLLPSHFPSSALQCLAPPTKDLAPPTTRSGGSEPGELRVRQNDEAVLKIKVDPDRPNPARSPWRPNPRPRVDREPDLQRGVAKQESPSPLPPPFSSSFIPISSSSSSSPPKIYPQLEGSSASSFTPLPSFSSSFLCPPPASSFPSSLHPLPSSPCSLPAPPLAGGRKGRVCCGVCGKSFYDKGTLKIHYNAVHLKIKHRCTVAGCAMVFSSLRSRNRHSANPNPRLHTGAGRDAPSDPRARGKEASGKLWRPGGDGREIGHVPQHGSNGHTAPHPLPPGANQNFACCDSTCRGQAPPPPPPLPPPPPPPHLLQTHCLPSASSLPSRAPEETERSAHPLRLHADHSALLPDHAPATGGERGESTDWRRQWESGDQAPKKKPRKSSTPVKIERETMEVRREEEEEEEEE